MSYGDLRGRAPYDFEEPRLAPDWYIPLSRPYKPTKAKSFEDWGFNRFSSPPGDNDRDEISPQRFFATQSNTLHNTMWTSYPEEDAGEDYTSARSRSLPPLPEENDIVVHTPPNLSSVPRSERPPVRVRRPSADDEGRVPSEGPYASRPHSLAMDDEDDTYEDRVRFRSPLISAKASSFGGSDADAGSDPGRPALLPDSFGSPGPPRSGQGPSVSSFARELSSARETTSPDNTPLADLADHEQVVASSSHEHQVPRSGDVGPHFDPQMQGKANEGS